MKLVTIQTKAAYDSLIKNGYLVADDNFINKAKYGMPYDYIISHMQNINNTYNAHYPLWAWAKYGKFASPPKNRLLGFFSKDDEELVRITFEKDASEMLINDYIKYHFLLTNEYLPKSIKDKKAFDQQMQSCNVSKEDLLAYVRRDKYDTYRQDKDFDVINQAIHNSYKDIFNLQTQYLQATVWHISLAEVKKVEIINKKDCVKKKSVDYRKMYINSLK